MKDLSRRPEGGWFFNKDMKTLFLDFLSNYAGYKPAAPRSRIESEVSTGPQTQEL